MLGLKLLMPFIWIMMIGVSVHIFFQLSRIIRESIDNSSKMPRDTNTSKHNKDERDSVLSLQRVKEELMPLQKYHADAVSQLCKHLTTLSLTPITIQERIVKDYYEPLIAQSRKFAIIAEAAKQDSLIGELDEEIGQLLIVANESIGFAIRRHILDHTPEIRQTKAEFTTRLATNKELVEMKKDKFNAK
ncbi:hypothetical protein D3C78_19880 [compost metagenome]